MENFPTVDNFFIFCFVNSESLFIFAAHLLIRQNTSTTERIFLLNHTLNLRISKVEKQTYTYDEAFAKSLEYFKGDELAARVWVNK